MRSRLARFFLFLAQWLDPECAVSSEPAALVEALLDVEPPPGYIPEQEIIKVALPLVKAAEKFAEGTSGEFKRHWVYSQLLKQFPRHPKHFVGLLLEQAVAASKAQRRR